MLSFFMRMRKSPIELILATIGISFNFLSFNCEEFEHNILVIFNESILKNLKS